MTTFLWNYLCGRFKFVQLNHQFTEVRLFFTFPHKECFCGFLYGILYVLVT